MNPETKILVVEDEIALCQSLKLIIQTLGVTVIDVINGTQAIEALRLHNVKIILCDINLPDISGYEILKQVKTMPELRNIPFILLTAFADEKDVNEGFELGAAAYITKPFSSRDLLQKLKSILMDE